MSPLISIPLIFLLSLLSTTTSAETLHLHNQLARSACQGTTYTDLCMSTLLSFPDLTSKTLPQIISSAVNTTINEVTYSTSNCTTLRRTLRLLNPRAKMALDDCLELLDETFEELSAALGDLSRASSDKKVHHVQTLLSAAITNSYTCLDGFYNCNDTKVWSVVDGGLKHVHKLVSNSLAMVKKIRRPGAAEEGVFEEYGRVYGGFPGWMSRKDRRLLQAAVGNGTLKADLVVAKDGSGNFTTVGEAVAAAPNASSSRFVIYIKAGAYFENVEVNKTKTNIMLVGDGIGKTVIKASRNVVDGWTTFRSATVAVVGNSFLARDLTIENSAGPSKHQAVALRVGSDLSVFYRCSFIGYQDTLYVHSLRQFYRECDIYGTSQLDDVVDPAGWLEWSGNFALSTLYYREYMNRGPGSNTSARVTWPGFKVTTNATEMAQFTVGAFIQGAEWLNQTAVPYRAGLS
ncbi:hypothetical protein QJS04_geneDACA019766 [Acorus gramineus]|uniref:pectinesterase n=1 Tax=Acorus gramineus TaxID=55184 RepID=A0AAV9BWI7_ACOGR|nr:hypothetical protein QJS04_geneDACA019766 [Acorus gramineus]